MRFLWRSLSIIVLLIVPFAMFGTGNSPVRAEAPLLDLQLGGEGAVAWVIGNIAPGQGGTKTLTLHNAGTATGFVTIWLSDILDLDGANPTGNTSGELSQYLQLQLITPRLGTSLAMPATIQQFPHSYDSPTRVTVSSLPPGDTQEIVWKWLLPAGTGNNVQGDQVIFTITYHLEEMPVHVSPLPPSGGTNLPQPVASPLPAPSPPPTAMLPIIDQKTGETKAQIELSKDGTLTKSVTATVLQGGVVLSINKGTSITTEDGKIPEKIEIATVVDTPPLPKGMVLVSPLYDITAYVDKEAKKVKFSQPLTLILRYSPGLVPEDAQALLVVYYDEELGAWTELELVSGLVAEEGEAAAVVSHFTKFAIVALVPPPQPPPAVITPAPQALMPARFQLSSLEISPSQINSDDVVTIRAQVTNTGGLSGERSVTLKMNGLFVDAKVVKLAPGETRTISFTVSPHKPGIYQVEIGEVKGSLTVSSGSSPFEEGASGRNWLFALTISMVLGSIAITAIALLIFHVRKSAK